MKRIDNGAGRLQFVLKLDTRVLALEQLFQLPNGGPFDRLAGDGAFEDVMGLVLRIDRQLKVEAIMNVNVCKDPRLTEFDNLLSLDIKLVTLVLQQIADQAGA